jgi:hypothetical protein
MTNPAKRYRKPTVRVISMMTVKEHNWVLRVSPLMYARWQEAGKRILQRLLAKGEQR